MFFFVIFVAPCENLLSYKIIKIAFVIIGAIFILYLFINRIILLSHRVLLICGGFYGAK